MGKPQLPALPTAARSQSPAAAGPATLPAVPHIRAGAGGSGRDAISLFLCRKRRAGEGPFLRALAMPRAEVNVTQEMGSASEGIRPPLPCSSLHQ